MLQLAQTCLPLQLLQHPLLDPGLVEGQVSCLFVIIPAAVIQTSQRILHCRRAGCILCAYSRAGHGATVLSRAEALGYSSEVLAFAGVSEMAEYQSVWAIAGKGDSRSQQHRSRSNVYVSSEGLTHRDLHKR